MKEKIHPQYFPRRRLFVPAEILLQLAPLKKNLELNYAVNAIHITPVSRESVDTAGRVERFKRAL